MLARKSCTRLFLLILGWLNILSVEKVQWFRTQADMMQWVEEVELIEDDFCRLIRGLETTAKVWRTLSNGTPLLYDPRRHTSPPEGDVEPWSIKWHNISRRVLSTGLFQSQTEVTPDVAHSYLAYAHQTAAMYDKMAQKARDLFSEAGGAWPSPGESLSDLLRRRRPRITVDWKEENQRKQESVNNRAKDYV